MSAMFQKHLHDQLVKSCQFYTIITFLYFATGAPKKTYKSKAAKWMIPREGSEDYVPPEVKATAEQLMQRKVLDQRRW